MSESYNHIISLVPSFTELLVDLGLRDRIVGRTRFCVHPKGEVQEIPIIGGTKNPRLDKIYDVAPDLIIANKEENRQEDIEALANDFEVELTEIETVEDALIAINKLGEKLSVPEQAGRLITRIQKRLDERPDVKNLRTAYLIWREPWMTIGRDTYIHDVMRHWNLVNVFGEENRYPVFKLDELADYNPELILLSSEPYPFKEKHIPEVEKACPGARVLLVDGEWFSWYGSHMEHAFERLNAWRKAID